MTRAISLAELEQLYPQAEQKLHEAVAEYLDLVLAADVVWTTFPAGGGGAARGAALKRMGLKPGWPDVQMLWKLAAGVRFLGIELKKLKTGRRSDDQIVMGERLEGAGAIVCVARTLDDVVRIVRDNAVPTKGGPGR